MAGTSGWTTNSRPWNPPLMIDASTACPSPPPSRRTPTTATVAGYSNGASEFASDTASRRSAAAIACAEASVLISTMTTPDCVLRETSNPTSPKTRIMAAFSGRTSATNRRTPLSRHAAARCSSSRLPSPWPCSSSATSKATSAESGPIRSAVATATMWLRTVATRVATVVPVPLDQVLDVPMSRLSVQGEEPQPEVVVAHPVMQGDQLRLVLADHGADRRDPPVGQEHVGRPGHHALGHRSPARSLGRDRPWGPVAPG